METLSRDIRYAFRRLLKSPGFTLLAIASLALGIGSNTAIFSLANALIFRGSPLERPDEVMWIYRRMPEFSAGPLSYPDFVDIRNDTRDIFSSMAGAGYTFSQLDRGDHIEGVMGEMVSGTYFTLQGLHAHIGRTFTADDDVSPGAHPVVMLSYPYWQRAFGGSPDVVGRTIRLSGHSYEVVGVVPENYPGQMRGFTPAFYVPISMMNQIQPGASGGDMLTQRSNQFFFARARLAPGVSAEQARVALARITADFQRTYPESWNAENELVSVPAANVILNPMIDRVVLSASAAAMVLTAMVLLIACANLATFLLARAADRKKEIAVRLALGARRSTLIRQLLTESALLALAGGVAGVALAVVAVRLGLSIELPFPIPIELDTGLDARVLGFSLGATVLAALFFGLAPALQSTKPEIAPTLKDESTGGGRPRIMTLRNVLVVGQMAGSLVLLVVAGLFLRGLGAARSIDPGFGQQPTALLNFGISERHGTSAEGRVWMQGFLERAAALPGVTAVGMTGNLHLNTMSYSDVDINVDGFDPPAGRHGHPIDRTQVDGGFFDAAGIPIVRGRAFDASDVADGRRVVVINEAMAERFWPGENPVGRVIREADGDELAIVGVAATAKIRSLGEPPRSFIYYPFSQSYTPFVTVLARGTGSAQTTATRLLALLRESDPDAIIVESKTMDDHLAVMLIPARLSVLLSTLFGGLAMILAVIGLNGVVGYAVAQRRREIGIRMALGASSWSVVRRVVGGGMTYVAVGAAIGLAVAFLATRLLRGLLFGVAPLDPVAFLAVPAALVCVSLLATVVPAWRASRVDPVQALKAQ